MAKEGTDKTLWDWEADRSDEQDLIKDHKIRKEKYGNGVSRRQTRVRGSTSQLEMLLSFMSQHREVALATAARDQHRALWSALARRLNGRGPRKTVDQWKKVWRGQRHRALKLWEQHERDPALLRLHAKDVTLQILDILQISEKTPTPPVRESSECKTTTENGGHSERVFVRECGGAPADDTPVVSWDWDPVTPAPAAPLAPRAPSNPRAPSACCGSGPVEKILERIEENQKSILNVAERQASLLEKLLEQSVRAAERQERQMDREAAIHERLLRLCENAAPPAPAVHPRHINRPS